MTGSEKRIQTFRLIILAYPVVLILGSLSLNAFAFGVEPPVVVLPSIQVVCALVISTVLLVFNHTWLMTATELTRLNYNIHASHEEWAQNDARKEDVAQQGWIELDRHHNAHRNATENTVYFVFLAFVVSMVSPSILATQIWFIGFAVARLGYTFSALHGKSGLRGIFMSLSLLALYGLASYLALSLAAYITG
jgi:uncharacterized MAPEG superfamily protein